MATAARAPRAALVAVVCGGLVLCLAMGTRQGFGLFLEPMTGALGWGRETFALAIALQNLFWGLVQPVVGGLADRYGAGRVAALGGLAYALGLALMAATESPLGFLGSAGLLVGLALSGTTFAVVLGAVGRAVPEERRSLALGLASAGGSVGQFVMIPAGQAFISAYGWEVALLILAAASLLIVPLAAGLTGKGAGGGDGNSAPAPAREQSMGEALREAAGHGGYLYLSAGFFVCGFQVTYVMVHLPAYLTDQGMSPATAAAALATIGFFNILGSLACGYLGGRHSKKYLLALLYLGRGAAATAFLLAPLGSASIFLFTAVTGLLWLGTVPLTTGLVAQIFGPRYVGTLFGIVFLSHQVGAFLGVWLGGYVYDATGSYALVWWIYAGLGVLAAALHWPIDERAVPRLAGAAE